VKRILLLGASTRALAESAWLSGHPIVSVDYFGDRDQKQLVENYALLQDFHLPLSVQGLAQASAQIEAEAVAYVGNLENYPEIVEELTKDRLLLGNGSRALREVRDWRTLRRFCREVGILYPSTLLPGEEKQACPEYHWLCKPIRSGGGHGIHSWDERPLKNHQILQAKIEGRPASVAFVADGRRSRILGVTEQLIGRPELGSSGFVWSGNIFPLDLALVDGGYLMHQMEEMVSWLTHRFGLRGVNGVDVMVSGELGGYLHPYLLEVNPRYSASMELVERANGTNLFNLHMDGLAGRLPDFSFRERSHQDFVGKGVVYARRAVSIADTSRWVERGIRDVPFPGRRIDAGHPVCTVLASGSSRQACFDAISQSAATVYGEIEEEREERCGRTAHLDHRAYA